jgi:hypothetical protein
VLTPRSRSLNDCKGAENISYYSVPVVVRCMSVPWLVKFRSRVGVKLVDLRPASHFEMIRIIIISVCWLQTTLDILH